MIGAGPVAIAARVAGLALLLVPPARDAEPMPVLPEQLAITRSIDVQDEDEFQTSLSARTASPTVCRRPSSSRMACAIPRASPR